MIALVLVSKLDCAWGSYSRVCTEFSVAKLFSRKYRF